MVRHLVILILYVLLLLFNSSLIKNHEERGGMEDLIKYEFIEKYLNENADTKFVGDLIDRIQADTDES